MARLKKIKSTSGLIPYSIEHWSLRTDAALTWLRRSIDATGGRGSAHSYSPLWGWAGAYPETTGYLIPTLLHYARIKQDASLRGLAGQCADWLCTVQLTSGAFPGGIVGQSKPSVFNTGQVLFGFVILDEEILAEENIIQKYRRHTLESAARWMFDLLEPDGAWRQAAYVPGFVPAYYTRAVWGLLEANRRLHWPELDDKMRLALHYYAQRFQPDGTVRDWGFWPGPWAFTHTIAYTLEGFLESALLLKEPAIVNRVVESAEWFLAVRSQNGRTAGRYGAGWRGDYTFRCLTGNAQLSVLYHRLWEVSGQEKFRQAASDFLIEILGYQNLGKNPNTYGALPGSAPLWGPYLRFRYPNWGVKFFLDALAL